MELSPQTLAGVSLAGHLCDAVGGLYLAYDIFRRHAGPLGVLTRTVTYSVVLALPGWVALGLPFGAISGTGLGLLISIDHWKLARYQRLQRSSPLTQSALSGMARGAVLGLACSPRFGWRFGLVTAGAGAALNGGVYALGLVPTYRAYGKQLRPPRSVLRAALLRALALGAAAALGALTVGGAGSAGSAASLGLEVAGLVGGLSIIVAVITPPVEYWTERAGDAFFVYAGLALLFCGLLCDATPDIVALLRP